MSRLLLLLCTCLLPTCALAQADASARPASGTRAATGAEASTNFSFVRYLADYVVAPDYTSTETDEYEVLVRTKAGVDTWSQVRLSYSEKMERLEVLAAYTITADGQRHDVAPDRIYTQESYSSASAAMYADRKVKVIVFPNLAPGTRVVYRYRTHQIQPYFAGYFNLWETFPLMQQYDQAKVTLTAPASMPMHLEATGMQGGQRKVADGQARWEWTYRNRTPMDPQAWSVSAWEFSPGIMASTFDSYGRLGRAYQQAAGQASRVTPEIQRQADAITAGIDDRRAQAQAIYEWVAANIRYVAVYLGNGGLEPNPAASILANHYGDCKDHTVILESLLAAKGIASSPVLIGAGGGPTLPKGVVLGRFNHAITWVPEFGLYLDSTSPYARFGQLPASDLGAPVVHTADGVVARTPANDPSRSAYRATSTFDFDAQGNVSGHTAIDSGASGEIGLRGTFSQLTTQNRQRIEDSIMASSGLNGQGYLRLQGQAEDLDQPFGYAFDFRAQDDVDFSSVGGMTLPDMPGADSMRELYAKAVAETNLTPFQCNQTLREETYVLRFPASVPVIAIPRSAQFENAAGRYEVSWARQGQQVTATHRLQLNAIHGSDQLCQPADYPAFRALYQDVRRGFRGQILYGDLATVQTVRGTGAPR
jgi:transglutaminase-like putative cysteine protease